MILGESSILSHAWSQGDRDGSGDGSGDGHETPGADPGTSRGWPDSQRMSSHLLYSADIAPVMTTNEVGHGSGWQVLGLPRQAPELAAVEDAGP